MHFWRRILAFSDSGASSPELRRAQYAELSRQVPLMYLIVIINMVMLSFTHAGRAPWVLTVAFPVAFTLICTFRAIKMMLARRTNPSDEVIVRALRTTVLLACVMGVAISNWSLLLFTYGDPYLKGQIAFFTGITIITVMTCLRPMRQIAPALFLLVVVPTLVFLGLQEHTVFWAIAVNMTLVMGGMIVVMQRSQSDFRQRIEKQIELDAQHRQLQALNDAVRVMANEDSLTGLANRRRFFEHLDRHIEDCGRRDETFALGILDLDGFKPVNDVFGHSVGDQLLREVARRLLEALPQDALLARLGGDEFGVILPDAGSDEELELTCRQALEALSPPFVFQEGSVTVSATCGLARFPKAATTAHELFEKADFALYYSKQHDRGTVTLFSDEHEEAIRRSAAVAQRLRSVQPEEAFHLEYQPIVDRDGRPLGFEALARWEDPVLGRVSPDVFIRAAEQAGLIGDITVPLFRRALEAVRSWPEELKLSFNLSAFDICSHKTMSALVAEIEAAGVAHDRLMFEITESAIMQDWTRATVALRGLREKGILVALDDFGTGYSSLSYLRRLPIDRIKLDRSFIADIEREPVARSILATISSLCHSLGLQFIVEGVETSAQLQILSQAGVTGYQGYLFSRPLPEEGVSLYLAEWRSRSSGGRPAEAQTLLSTRKTAAPAPAPAIVAAPGRSQ
ncbi:GGDEF-domain containing protein [Pseudorhizobium endolithicum]|uniref:GGDEF-domain containing protein n=1 Tax=Pseudorhizobium endolithicum TaxID=1191678 RepID=A0ABN7JVU0_9HYPH|nr:EAL domain-containing protein [Pseudorhizobium endolithicum]CAD7050786.1 GGDEF-domain containing protein [Pseudorhizobium endolithicum]